MVNTPFQGNEFFFFSSTLLASISLFYSMLANGFHLAMYMFDFFCILLVLFFNLCTVLTETTKRGHIVKGRFFNLFLLF